MNNFKTEQEAFWAGEFGSNYIDRNSSLELLASNVHFFSKILTHTTGIKSILELGANVGMNMTALKVLLPEVETSGIEINEDAVKQLQTRINKGNVYHQSILDFTIDYKRDFVFTKGVLIHLNPEYLSEVYRIMYDSSNKYICVAEYYNPKPESIPYRGHEGFLFKRDFAGEIMNRYPDLKLVDYGFAYHRDNLFKQDDITWFLLSK